MRFNFPLRDVRGQVRVEVGERESMTVAESRARGAGGLKTIWTARIVC
jgi:hypothetical protein